MSWYQDWFLIVVLLCVMFPEISGDADSFGDSITLGYTAPKLYLSGIRITKTVEKPVVTTTPVNNLKLLGIRFKKFSSKLKITTFFPNYNAPGVALSQRESLGAFYFSITPNPALIFQNAPPGTHVLTITGLNNDTGVPLENVRPVDKNNEDYQYFSVEHASQQQWVLQTARYITKPLNFTFRFSLSGGHPGYYQEKDVTIRVVEQNLFSPTFEHKRYEFLAYIRSYEEEIKILGTVKAHDNDTQSYNSNFHYYILDRTVTPYFNVDPNNGKIVIVGAFPHSISQYTFQVTAIDGGSPQKLGITQVVVNITDVRAPEIFCVSVDGVQARICWKDPTNGAYVERYQLQISMNDQNVTSHPVVIRGKKNEVCTQVRANSQQRAYRFSVKVFNKTLWSPKSVQRFVNITKDGLYGDCANFSDCSVLQPCANGGTCKTLPDMSYRCQCRDHYEGQNCTDINLCDSNPCQNNGTCSFIDHLKYKCICPDKYTGQNCSFYDSCASNSCLNNGKCVSGPDGSHKCVCLPNFSGNRCENPDPCYPSPCQHESSCTPTDPHSYKCTCPAGYKGSKCEKIDLCNASPCNNGNCSFVDDGRYICTCYPGFVGNHCNIPDPCYFKSCENNGRCVNVSLSHAVCSCPKGYWGESCEHFNHCIENPCVTGICNNKTDSKYTCTCNGGHYGPKCERTNPCISSPCLASGTCTNTSDTNYTCKCMLEKFGRNCQFTDGCKMNLCEHGSECKMADKHGRVHCGCKNGTYGEFCQHVNLCVSSPCQNGGKCSNVSNKDYTCNCTHGWAGKNCEVIDPCLSEPCQNHAICRYDVRQHSYVCHCPKDFSGNHCEKFDFCAPGNNMCLNGAACRVYSTNLHQLKINHTTANVTNWFKCDCPHGFEGEKCDLQIAPCTVLPCGNGGTCIHNGTNGYFCQCRDGTTRPVCKEDMCPSVTSLDKTGKFFWPSCLPGKTISLSCPHGSHGHGHELNAIRKCAVNSKGEAFWEEPITSACQELSEEEADRRLQNLIGLTGDASHLTSEVIANVTHSLENLVVFAFDNNKLAQEVAQVVSNLLEAQERALVESNHRNHSSQRLIDLLHDYTSEVQTDTNTSIETANINIMVVNFSVPDTQSQNKKEAFSYSPELKHGNNSEHSGVLMSLPLEVFDMAGKSNVRLEFVSYRTSALFLPEDSPPAEVVLKQRVITATVHDVDIKNLTSPVEYSIQNIEVERNHTCVFWDVPKRVWSVNGMETVATGGHMTDCRAYHLTSFAVLLDPSPSFVLADKHDIALTTISYIGCAISIFGLMFTIITYSMFRSLNRERSGKILLNMCASMLLMNVSFIVMAVTSREDGDAICTAVAILIHYFLLTSLTWMCTEAINMYQALITVFTKYSSYFILKRCIVAWGLPAVVVAITMGVNSLDNYRSKTQFCFISQASSLAFYITLLGPACCILLVNTIIFTLVARVIMKPKFKGHSPKGEKQETVTPAQVRGAFTVMVLLGITWVFGPVAINESKIVFYYLFTILNSLQGFLIFVFRCLFNTEVRSAWVLLIKTGQFKRRRGPIKSESNTSKAYHESRMNGSTADNYSNSGKTNTTNSNGWHNRTHVILNNERCKQYDMNKNKNGRRQSNESEGRRLSDGSSGCRHSNGSSNSVHSSASSGCHIYNSSGHHFVSESSLHYSSDDRKLFNESDFTKL